MCGASTAFARFQAPDEWRARSRNIQPRARNLPASSASTSAASSTTGPRDVLIKNAVGFILRNFGASNNRRVSGSQRHVHAE